MGAVGWKWPFGFLFAFPAAPSKSEQVQELPLVKYNNNGNKGKKKFLLTLQKTKVKYEGAKTPCATSWTWKNEVGSRLESANATFRHSCYGKRSSLDLF